MVDVKSVTLCSVLDAGLTPLLLSGARRRRPRISDGARSNEALAVCQGDLAEEVWRQAASQPLSSGKIAVSVTCEAQVGKGRPAERQRLADAKRSNFLAQFSLLDCARAHSFENQDHIIGSCKQVGRHLFQRRNPMERRGTGWVAFLQERCGVKAVIS